MDSIVRDVAVAALLLSGVLAGLSLDKVIVQLPARHRMGAVAYAGYARAADLGFAKLSSLRARSMCHRAGGPASTMPGGHGRPGCCRQSGEHEAARAGLPRGLLTAWSAGSSPYVE